VGSLERKLKRKQDKKSRTAEKKVATKIAQFQKLPDKCLTCDASFDKKSKEFAMNWRVVVNGENVRLYCKECWNNACNILEDHMEKKNVSL
jgi:hypothetical protein|tara:strand:+ start:75 stop:347 length:273 start_codon:yes stop_codon:yes gene_type:complete